MGLGKIFKFLTLMTTSHSLSCFSEGRTGFSVQGVFRAEYGAGFQDKSRRRQEIMGGGNQEGSFLTRLRVEREGSAAQADRKAGRGGEKDKTGVFLNPMGRAKKAQRWLVQGLTERHKRRMATTDTR